MWETRSNQNAQNVESHDQTGFDDIQAATMYSNIKIINNNHTYYILFMLYDVISKIIS